MVKHNNVVPNGHFHKDWQNRVKCWFDQPARKKRRRLARKAKAIAIAPRPVAGLLRPAVRGQTNKYNAKVRVGRGFTLRELKEAGINAKEARNIGIAVDPRRTNKSVEGLQINVQRLKAYKAKLVVFPRGRKAKAGDSTKAERDMASQYAGELVPLPGADDAVEFVTITDEMKNKRNFMQLQQARLDKRMKGLREKRAREEAEKKKAMKGKKKK